MVIMNPEINFEGAYRCTPHERIRVTRGHKEQVPSNLSRAKFLNFYALLEVHRKTVISTQSS
jgi:hypothetical protein